MADELPDLDKLDLTLDQVREIESLEQKLKAGNWYVGYTETSDEYGRGPAGLTIGPHQDDAGDSFLFSETLSASDGPPDELEAIFGFVAAARTWVPQACHDLRILHRQLEEKAIIELAARRAHKILENGIKHALRLEYWPNLHSMYGAGLFADGVARLLNEEMDKLRADVTRLTTALQKIQQWDCLNPPDPRFCHDHPWLKRTVDDALAGKPYDMLTPRGAQ